MLCSFLHKVWSSLRAALCGPSTWGLGGSCDGGRRGGDRGQERKGVGFFDLKEGSAACSARPGPSGTAGTTQACVSPKLGLAETPHAETMVRVGQGRPLWPPQTNEGAAGGTVSDP